jgi:hypothetical protein
MHNYAICARFAFSSRFMTFLNLRYCKVFANATSGDIGDSPMSPFFGKSKKKTLSLELRIIARITRIAKIITSLFLHSKEKVEMCVLDATSPNAAAAANSVSADSAVPALEKSIYDPDSLDLNTTVNSSAGEPSTAESTGEMPPAKSVTAISSPAGNK